MRRQRSVVPDGDPIEMFRSRLLGLSYNACGPQPIMQVGFFVARTSSTTTQSRKTVVGWARASFFVLENVTTTPTISFFRFLIVCLGKMEASTGMDNRFPVYLLSTFVDCFTFGWDRGRVRREGGSAEGTSDRLLLVVGRRSVVSCTYRLGVVECSINYPIPFDPHGSTLLQVTKPGTGGSVLISRNHCRESGNESTNSRCKQTWTQ
jgi:hypothetical protein